MPYKYMTLLVTLSILLTTSCGIRTASSVVAASPALSSEPSPSTPPTVSSSKPIIAPTSTNQPSTLSPSPLARLTSTSLPQATQTPVTPTQPSQLPNSPAALIFFPIGPGFADVIPHQIVRTNTDRVYIFAGATYSTILHAYWTTTPGLPNDQSAFKGSAQVTESGIPMSVDAVYDGGNIIHVLVVTQSDGKVKDYPFDISTDTFKSPITLASDSHTVSGDYIGSSGVSGMVDKNGTTLHVAYWTNMNHVNHRAYSYTSSTNTLTPTSEFVQVDSSGNANHPSIAISPADNSLTIAWVSQADSPARIRARTRSSDGIWGAVESVSTAPVWTSVNFGINIDQGPSLVINSKGTKQLTYIENNDATNDYGHIHYVFDNGSGWTDQAVNAYTHDPALALNSAGEMYIIGHGHPLDLASACSSMDDMCTIKKNTGGTWNIPQLFATHSGSLSFDSSPSVKWSVVGFNRPETIEFLFFATPYQTPTLYYGRMPTSAVPTLSAIYLPLVIRSP